MIKIQYQKSLDDYFKKLDLSFNDLKTSTLYNSNAKYKECVTYIEKNLKTIICEKPNVLREHINKINSLSINFILNRKTKDGSLTTVQQNENEFIKKLRKIFDYDNKIDKPEFAKEIGLTCCPYCNREYIFRIYDDKKNAELRTLAVLDHYYDKGKYPYLALSFYNLIPSCNICNSKFKTTVDFKENKHLHPYEDSFNEKARFTKFFNNVNSENKKFDLLSKERISLALKPLNANDSATQNTIDTFRLETLYQEHKDIVLELIQKAQVYNESYIDELYQKYEGTLFKNREDVLRHITSGYMEDQDINKRPLSKLIKDISEELDLI
ncbi:MAG: hypothetical protein C0625_03595 [Arcobacter sp.]|nr:MAG: hypothetical protein C0625_03595 [Arcobacter sp.]